MCGIAGFFSETPQPRDQSAETLRRMTTQITHRGPDAMTTWHSADGMVHLGHTRLAILDLTPSGAQPMRSRDGRLTLIYNGEIYNYAELRTQLGANGATFLGTSDTEVLLEAIALWGVPATLPKLNGMFAFAVWDSNDQKLWLARDRFGEKPLYYGVKGGTCVFASELKAVVQHPLIGRKIDRSAIPLYARFNYIPAPYSIYSAVRKLEPAHYLCVCPGEVQAVPRCYWSLHDMVAARRVLQIDARDPALLDFVDQSLRRAVRKRMVADVPLGAFLSGGIDSSTVVSMMQAQSGCPVKTFTIGFKEAAHNEAADAAAVAKFLGTDHHELYFTARECSEAAAQLPSIYDEPFADSSQIPTLLVSRFAHKHVKVALSGDGGDEFWGGYNRYFWTSRLWPLLRRIPLLVRDGVSSMIESHSPGEWDVLFGSANRVLPKRLRVRAGGEKLHKVANSVTARTADELYTRFVSQWPNESVLLPISTEPTYLDEKISGVPDNIHYVERMMYLDAQTYLPDDILCKVDRAAMSTSLETRVPFLDNELVELAWSLPLPAKILNGVGKWQIRRVLGRYVPEQLFNRPKSGFGMPIGEWLRGDLRDWAYDILCEETLRDGGYFNAGIVQRMLDEHMSGRRNCQHALWGVLMFESWRRANRP